MWVPMRCPDRVGANRCVSCKPSSDCRVPAIDRVRSGSVKTRLNPGFVLSRSEETRTQEIINNSPEQRFNSVCMRLTALRERCIGKSGDLAVARYKTTAQLYSRRRSFPLRPLIRTNEIYFIKQNLRSLLYSIAVHRFPTLGTTHVLTPYDDALSSMIYLRMRFAGAELASCTGSDTQSETFRTIIVRT